MKKKIILFLSFLLTAMFLAGCSEKTIEGTKIEKMAEIANNVINKKGYELPEGYTVSYPDGTTNARIEIEDSTNYLDAIFDVSGEQAKLVEISIYSMFATAILAIILGIVAIALLFFGIPYILVSKKERKKEENE